MTAGTVSSPAKLYVPPEPAMFSGTVAIVRLAAACTIAVEAAFEALLSYAGWVRVRPIAGAVPRVDVIGGVPVTLVTIPLPAAGIIWWIVESTDAPVGMLDNIITCHIVELIFVA